jgi:hypothetical protein
MSKIILLGDTHLSARGGSSKFSKFFNKFFTDVLYPYVDKHDIKTIYQLGDLFDNRVSLSLKAYHASKDEWFGPLQELNCTMHVLLGNHDIVHKNTLKINSPELLLGEYKNINIINKPQQIDIFDVIPWICQENENYIFNEFINRPNRARYCLGHFEFSGFPMYKGSEPLDHGYAHSAFDNYEMVFSGHFHHKSSKGNIQYVGTPYEITWSDYSDPKGFHVLDTKTGVIQFIENPYTIFSKIIYNDGWSGDINSVRDKIIRVIVQEKNDIYKFDRFIDSIKMNDPHEVIIVENMDEFKNGEVEENVNLEDSSSIINSYIDSLSTDVDKTQLKNYIQSLYNEALTL